METYIRPGAQYICRKCGEELYLDDVENWSKLSCPSCDEPIPQEELISRAGNEDRGER
jgi:predicted RNA-binding Zn-ribbon protein involved in translation (DUF1610 family)